MSEDDSIRRFEPHRARTALTDEPLVWAIDTRHLPLFWFPRDCPRMTFWAGPRASDHELERFLYGIRDRRVHAVESSWLESMRTTRLVAYRMPEEPFEPDAEVAGYWVSREAVEPLELVDLGDPFANHAAAGIELRLVPNLSSLVDRVVGSNLEFSGIRLRNAHRSRARDSGRRTESR